MQTNAESDLDFAGSWPITTSNSFHRYHHCLPNIQEGVINIKPLVNLTINKLGLLDGEGSSEKADSPTNVLKSMFRIWNPEVGVESARGRGGGYLVQKFLLVYLFSLGHI